MAYSLGEATGTVKLDISDVDKKTAKIQEDFNSIAKSSNEVVKSVEDQAKAFESVLGKAYKAMEQSLNPVQKANKALDELLESNKQKVEQSAAAVRSASSIQEQAYANVVKAGREVAQAQAEINRALREYDELARLNTLPNRNFDLSAKEKEYIKALDDAAKAEQRYNEAVKEERAAIELTAQAEKEHQKVLQTVKEVNDQAHVAVAQLADEYTNYTNRVKKSTNEVAEANKDQSRDRAKQLEDEKNALQDLGDAQENASKQQALAFGIAAKAVDEVVEGVKKLTQELINLSKQVLDIGSDFETSMAQVAATTGMTAFDVSNRISDYQDLVDAAKEAGLTTIFSASEAGEALNYLALAGYNVEQSIETMPDILTIAAAGAMDLGRASDMVTDAMNALDLEIGNTGDFIDKMAKTAQSSNTNVEQLGRAILTVGGTATVLSGGVQELDTALGLLANSGIKARQGGTALRQILLNLTAPAKNGAEMIEQLGLQIFDAEGNMRPLKDIFTDLNNIMADFTDQQRMQALNAIFDARQIRAANALLQATGEKWDTLETKIGNAEGAAERMAETMRSNLNGALNIAKSNLEAIAITIYEGVNKNITDLVEDAIPKFKELNATLASPEMQSRLKEMSKSIKEISLRLLDVATSEIPKLLSFLTNISAHLETLRVAITTIIGLNLLTRIPKIVAAVQALNAVLITQPWLAVIAAVGALIAILNEYEAEVEAQHKAMVESAKAELDAWEEQRTEIHSVVEEWNSYKEESERVVKENKAHVDGVKALYNEYKNLYSSGQNATLALEALADEIPEVRQMLDDGTASFDTITEAVNKYCDALERANTLRGGKADYVQAIETRDALREQRQAAKDALDESYHLWEEADKKAKQYEEEVRNAGEGWTKEQTQHLDDLQADADALLYIYSQNAQAFGELDTALAEAEKTAIEAEEAYNDALIQEGLDAGIYFKDKAKARKAEGDAYAKAAKEASAKETKAEQAASEALADKIDRGIEDIQRHISLRDEGYDDQSMIDFYEKMFGSDENWDRNNERLVKHYDKYRTLVEKKEEGIRKQMEADQKERDKIAKENERKQKEQDDTWKKLIEKGLSDIDWTAGFEEWTLQEQTEAYKKYLKDNEKFYATHAEEREKITRKIQELEKDAAKEQTKVGDEAAKKYIKDWTDGYDKLIDRATKAYQELEKKRVAFQNNLLKGVKLYTEETSKVWNRFTQQYEESTGMQVSSKGMKEQLKELQDYDKALDKLKARGVSDELMSEILGMDTEKGLEFANALNKMSTKELNDYVNAYQAVHDKTSEMTADYYKTELEKFETEYMIPLKEYVSGDQSELRKAYERLGIDSVQGYLDGLNTKAGEAEGATKAIYADCLQDVRDILGIHSPSTEFYEIGENTIQGFLNGVQSRASQLADIFKSLGQKAGESFVSAFKQTWDNFVDLITIGGGLNAPVSMVSPMFGTPAMAGNQMIYNTTNSASYTGLTRDDIVAAVKEALPGGDVVMKIDQTEFAKISRDSLNKLAENGEMGLKV